MAFPGMPALAGRWRRLEERLAKHPLERFLVTSPPNVRYLSGFSGSTGWLLFRSGETPVLFTDFRYEEQAATEVPADVEVHLAREGLAASLGEYLSRTAASVGLGFEPEYVSVLERRRLEEVADGAPWIEVPAAVQPLRAVKEEGEVDLIREAARVAEAALARTLDAVRSERGLTERAIAARLEFELRRGGSDSLPFDVIVAGGTRTSLPHAQPGDRRLEEGDLLMLDFGASIGGYCCDITRTVVVGEASSWQRDLHAAVGEAQAARVQLPHGAAAGIDVVPHPRRRAGTNAGKHRPGSESGHSPGLAGVY